MAFNPKGVGLKAQIISLLIAVSLIGLWFVGTRPLPESLLTRINITYDDYSSAFAKWDAQDVEEYIITVEHKGTFPNRAFIANGIHTLHVTPGQVALLNSTNADIPKSQRNFDGLTVNALFKRVADPDKRVRRCDYFVEPIYYEHVIHFDEQVGYPRWIEVIAQNNTGREIDSLECGSGYVIEVKSVQILKRC